MKQSKRFSLSKQDLTAWGKNLLMFTSPALVVLFTLLGNGVPFQKAYPVALLALYGAIADLIKKWKAGKN